MTTQIAFETHSLTTDNESGIAAPFEWQEGWLYELTGDAESTASRSEET